MPSANSVTSARTRRRYSARRAVLDVFALLNIGGLAAAEASAMSESKPGFALYAFGVLALYVCFWLALRRFEFPIPASIALQLVIVGHLAGRFVHVDGVQLYQVVVLGVHMDKVIHALNSALGAVFIVVLFRQAGLRLRGWEGFVVVMVACGLGALIEIIEFASTYVLATHNVGDYVNNAQDLVANLVGALVGWGIARCTIRDTRRDAGLTAE